MINGRSILSMDSCSTNVKHANVKVKHCSLDSPPTPKKNQLTLTLTLHVQRIAKDYLLILN